MRPAAACIMFTEHGRHYPDIVSRKRRLATVAVSRLADEVNAVCGFSARALADKDGFGARRIEVIENGIDLDRYEPARIARCCGRSSAWTRRAYIICVARFHPVKDHRTLLQAFARVARRDADVDLLLAGDGPTAELEAQAPRSASPTGSGSSASARRGGHLRAADISP